MVATADGTLDMPTVFLSRGSLASGGQAEFNLLVIEAGECGCAWLHYKVNNAKEKWASMT